MNPADYMVDSAATSAAISFSLRTGKVAMAGLAMNVELGFESGETTEIVLKASLKQPENC